jgi:hypothetical protein
MNNRSATYQLSYAINVGKTIINQDGMNHSQMGGLLLF